MTIKSAAVLGAVALAAFLLLRPVLGGVGEPEAPEVTGQRRIAAPPGVEAFGGPAPAAGKTAGVVDPVEKAILDSKRSPAGAAAISHLPEVERRIFELTNEERSRAQRSALQPEPGLDATARAQSDDMLQRGFFDHINPDGEAPWDRVAIHHRRLVGLVGENIWEGKGFSTKDAAALASLIVRGWMNSKGHRENILRPESTHLGVGLSVAGDEIRATQNFATILAYVDQPVPEKVGRGALVPLAITSLAGGPRAEMFDLWSARTGLAVSKPLDLASGRLDAAPGVYKLRFYFPRREARSYAIYDGPQVEIERR
jgi:uncharacterized protein YkwD